MGNVFPRIVDPHCVWVFRRYFCLVFWLYHFFGWARYAYPNLTVFGNIISHYIILSNLFSLILHRPTPPLFPSTGNFTVSEEFPNGAYLRPTIDLTGTEISPFNKLLIPTNKIHPLWALIHLNRTPNSQLIRPCPLLPQLWRYRPSTTSSRVVFGW